MKLFGCLLALAVLLSCAKTSVETPVTPLPVAGAVTGTIKAFDKYGNLNSNYTDVTVKLIDRQNQLFTTTIGQNGMFAFDNVVFGNITLAVHKPGYGFIDSLKFNHQKTSDTLTDVYLIEELPFSFNLSSVSYSNSMLRITGSYTYQSTDSYMVTEFLCFSKDPNVSINHTNLLWSPSSHTNVQFLAGFVNKSSSLSLSTLTNAGFQIGDRIYVTVIPSIGKFWTSYYDQNKNYNILHYKVGNTSNVVSFILSQ